MAHVHELKTWPRPFQAVLSGEKSMELRRDDRSSRYDVGHRLHLFEYDPDLGDYTGRQVLVEVTSTYREESAVPRGHVLMAVRPVDV